MSSVDSSFRVTLAPMQRVRPILELPATERPAHLEVPDPYNLTLPGRWPRRA
jgi:hypothetical protein